MNKSQLIDAVAAQTNQTKAQTAATLDALLETIQTTLAGGDSIQLIGFGSFSVTGREAREGRNPATGEPMTIAAKRIVKFKPGKTMSEAVAK